MTPAREAIPADAITVPVVIGAAGRDAVWDSSGSAASIMSRLPPVSNGSAPGHVNLTFPATRHVFVAPPFIPYAVGGEGGPDSGTSSLCSPSGLGAPHLPRAHEPVAREHLSLRVQTPPHPHPPPPPPPPPRRSS